MKAEQGATARVSACRAEAAVLRRREGAVRPDAPVPDPRSRVRDPQPRDDETTCPRCGESHELAKVKGCLKCLKCGFKFDCNGW